MKCPVCGAKMVDGKICKYCNVTREQVLNASNKEAKVAFKEKRYNDVCYSTNIPSDVNKLKLILFTIFLGWYGVGYFYIGRKIKGLFCAISMGVAILFSILTICVTQYGLGGVEIIKLGFNISTYLVAVVLLMWAWDIFGFIFKNYKVPVVLATEEVEYKHHSLKK